MSENAILEIAMGNRIKYTWSGLNMPTRATINNGKLMFNNYNHEHLQPILTQNNVVLPSDYSFEPALITSFILIPAETTAETLYSFVVAALTAIARNEGKSVQSVFVARSYVGGAD